MDVDRDLEYGYGWNRYTMTFMGLWPENRNLGRISSYRAMVPILMMLCFVCAPQSANLPFIWGDFDLVIENLSMGNITITISMLKTVVFWSNSRHLKALVTCMTKDWNLTVDKRDRKTMLDVARITRSLSIYSTLLCQTVLVTYVAMRCYMIRQIGRQMFFRGYFPYNATVSPLYEFTFVGQILGATYAAITYTTVDTFIATLVLHTCGQLSNLRRELTDLRAGTSEEFQARLGKIVIRHEYLNRFAETIEDNFNMMLLMQMLGCSVQLCCQCLQAFMSVVSGEINEFFIFQFIFLVPYVIYVLLQLYLYCYIGERLLVESTQIAYAAYDCSWYDLSAYEVRSLIIIIYRARSPLTITAGRFCSFNRELFSEVLKRSVAYMSCLYAMKGTQRNEN
ncbi:ObirOr5-T3 [Ooceraea biroi]|uniref:Odorant receptor n=1 Tax=Ooceraea biroi TaxID=2015173 RepID=A0A3L8DFE4_OOCBI|nr:odorant receptor 13a isoform X1 [Ooceraea biroi]RLU18883.1 ObirOr5-T3 [Ooceraea biroi]